MSATEFQSSTPCPRCGGQNRQGAQFCAACGASLGAMAPPPPPPSRSAGGGVTQSVTINLDAASAFNHAVAAVQSAGCDVQWQSPPSELRFGWVKRSFWTAAGVSTNYDGVVSISPMGAGQSQARVSLSPDWGSAGLVLLINAVAAVIVVIFLWFYLGLISLLVVAIGMAIVVWRIASQWPQGQARVIAGRLQVTGVGHPPSPAATAPRPVEKPPEAPAKSDAAKSDVFDQIKRLGELRAEGVLTDAEFEAKKAELLTRL